MCVTQLTPDSSLPFALFLLVLWINLVRDKCICLSCTKIRLCVAKRVARRPSVSENLLSAGCVAEQHRQIVNKDIKTCIKNQISSSNYPRIPRQRL